MKALRVYFITLSYVVCLYSNGVHAQDVGLLSEAISVGLNIDGTCDYQQARALVDAWTYLTFDIRSNSTLNGHVFNCLQSAKLVETDCATQMDRSGLQRVLLADEYHWQVECIDFPPGHDMNGNPTRTLADGRLGIEGAKMRADKMFLSTGSKEEIAATMAHELMHNRGFSHDQNPFGTTYYSLTVPEQAEACIRNINKAIPQNPAPYQDYWDRKVCCDTPGTRFCDSLGCYTTTDFGCFADLENYMNVCGMFIQPVGGDLYYPITSEAPDAGMCGISASPLPIDVPPTTP